jgi:hypothetical protein
MLATVQCVICLVITADALNAKHIQNTLSLLRISLSLPLLPPFI